MAVFVRWSRLGSLPAGCRRRCLHLRDVWSGNGRRQPLWTWALCVAVGVCGLRCVGRLLGESCFCRHAGSLWDSPLLCRTVPCAAVLALAAEGVRKSLDLRTPFILSGGVSISTGSVLIEVLEIQIG